MGRPVRAPDIAELRAFCAAVDLGSLGRAARLMGVTQPALSKRLRTLEALAGATLLERSPRGVTLTAAGTRLYVEARKLLAQAEAVEALMAGLAARSAHTPGRKPHDRRVRAAPAARRVRAQARAAPVGRARDRQLARRARAGAEGRAEFGSPRSTPGRPAADARDCRSRRRGGGRRPAGHPWAELAAVPLESFTATPMVMRDPSANTRRAIEARWQRGLALAPLARRGRSTSAARDRDVGGRPVLLSRLAIGRPRDPLVAVAVEGVRFERRFVFLLGDEANLSGSARALLHHLRAAHP